MGYDCGAPCFFQSFFSRNNGWKRLTMRYEHSVDTLQAYTEIEAFYEAQAELSRKKRRRFLLLFIAYLTICILIWILL